MATVTEGLRRIVWAVDPFHERPADQLRSLRTALALCRPEKGCRVEPVAVLRLGDSKLPGAALAELRQNRLLAAEKALQKLVARLKLASLAPPRLLQQEGFSLSDCARQLLHHAVTSGADAIAVSSHGRKGAARAILGSFAESLVIQSPLPVLVVRPETAATSGVRTVLFPTDFSAPSRVAFDRTVEIAASIGAQLLLFHKVQFLHPEFHHPFVVPPVSRESIQAALGEIRATANAWIGFAARQGVRAKLHLDTRRGRPVDEIAKAAKKLGTKGLIALASQSGELAAVVLGSLTRQLLRAAPCPLLVLHPKQESLVERFLDEARQLGYSYTAKPVMT